MILKYKYALRVMFILLYQLQEQIEWAVEARADFMIAETYGDLAEAMVALECIKTYGKGTT